MLPPTDDARNGVVLQQVVGRLFTLLEAQRAEENDGDRGELGDT